jgi:hypothetical protein
MGLHVDDTYDVPVVHHGRDLTGYHSDWYAIPNADVTAVILTNADDGARWIACALRSLHPSRIARLACHLPASAAKALTTVR